MLFAIVCDGCGRTVANRCETCRGALLALVEPLGDPVLSALHYDGLARRLVLGLKYRHHRSTAETLAEALLVALRARGVGDRDVVTWVPTTTERRRVRGIDHAELIARCVARSLGIRAVDSLHKLDDSRQTGAGRARRLSGVRVATHRRVVGLRVVLVDDVVTTGASMRACRDALLAAGAADVLCAAVARAPGPSGRR